MRRAEKSEAAGSRPARERCAGRPLWSGLYPLGRWNDWLTRIPGSVTLRANKNDCEDPSSQRCRRRPPAPSRRPTHPPTQGIRFRDAARRPAAARAPAFRSRGPDESPRRVTAPAWAPWHAVTYPRHTAAPRGEGVHASRQLRLQHPAIRSPTRHSRVPASPCLSLSLFVSICLSLCLSL